MKARLGDRGQRAVSAPEVYAELDRLPERFRAPIVLCHLEGLTNEQAAVQLGLPVRTVPAPARTGPRAFAGSAWPARHRAGERRVRSRVRSHCGFRRHGSRRRSGRPSGMAAGRETAAVASAAVAALTQGVLTMMFIGRLKIVAAAVMAAGAVMAASGRHGRRNRVQKAGRAVDAEGRGGASRVEC